ncbi:hypothetical protein CIRG_04688 [Coccidioides immitis RMSCC 2394]|uniref:Uncharacterized protein n=1 Tax=Coccidioides immitis RMSCC 2394 TaxID=404692 RepID=A0A0J7B560_COCIT|nr:hypothetical protein CIRG_04688 [Coccidioides immitis RMSCC 2394]
MAMVHHKHITVNTNNMKLVLGISAKIRSNYFDLINVSDYPTSAVTIHHLYAVSVPPTTAAAAPSPPLLPIIIFLPFSDAIRVSACQMAVSVCLLASAINLAGMGNGSLPSLLEWNVGHNFLFENGTRK